MLTNADYNFPCEFRSGYFYNKNVIPFTEYLDNYHVHFMRYLYFMCIMNAEGEYPNNLNVEEINNAFQENEARKQSPSIKKILVCEAPPPIINNYFYNASDLRWNTTSGNPTIGQNWTSTIKNTLFPGVFFTDTVSFLKACANEGFLILDLFPYPIKYNNRKSIIYKEACINAFGFGNAPYRHNIISTLSYLNPYISNTISFGFALTSFGRIILSDNNSVNSFNHWCYLNNVNLTPEGSISIPRIVQAPVLNASEYLRICHRRPMLGPCSILLNLAGF